METGAETGGRRIPAQGRMPGAPQKLGEAGRTLPWSLCREPSPGTPGLQTSGPQEETGCLRVISNALLGPEGSEVGPRGWRSNKARMCRERRDPRITAPADGLSGGAPGHGKGRPLKRGEPRSRHHSWALEWSSSVLHRQCNSSLIRVSYYVVVVMPTTTNDRCCWAEGSLRSVVLQEAS